MLSAECCTKSAVEIELVVGWARLVMYRSGHRTQKFVLVVHWRRSTKSGVVFGSECCAERARVVEVVRK